MISEDSIRANIGSLIIADNYKHSYIITSVDEQLCCYKQYVENCNTVSGSTSVRGIISFFNDRGYYFDFPSDLGELQ